MEKKLNLKNFLVASLSLAVAGSLVAQERLVPKQLSGPIEEARSGVMAEVAPIEAGIHSKSAMIPVSLQQTKNGDWRWQGEVAVDNNRFNMVMFSGQDSWTVNLRQPHAKSAAPAHVLATELDRSSLSLGNNSFEGDYYHFAEAQPGNWAVSVEVDAPIGDKGYLLYSSDSAYRLLSYQTSRAQLVGQEIGFVSYGYQTVSEGPRIEANAGMVEQAWLRVTTPAGDELRYAMFDDGLHGDQLAGDGIFGGSFSAEAVGEYQAQVIAQGTTPEGFPFVRTAEHVVPVIARTVELAHDFATAELVDNKRLQISLAVNNLADAPEKYRVFAEVWGADAEGQMQPVNWIGGYSYVENGQLNLGLDLRWIGLSKASNSFELRNLRIEDPDTFIPVARAESLSLMTPNLPAVARLVPKAMDEEMFVGPRPARESSKAGGRLLLVHGYCSGDAWGPVSGQFSNDSVFLDTNQNRSHDAFANLIASFGSSYSSYGIVAHSQGGAASLHLYTYYWSGLDYATGGRLIQSVGTPYQGTALAGNAAVLGQIFGVGCGTNYDLTYSGASAWLSGVPTWARNAVNYYTTSFTDKWWRYDYCHLVTDLLLDDPDDGTTEKAYGQLSSGINRGHKTGWCHTTGMRDAPQTTDSGRNSTMNSNAAN